MMKFLILTIFSLLPMGIFAASDFYCPQTITCKQIFINNYYKVVCKTPPNWTPQMHTPGAGTYTFFAASDGDYAGSSIGCLYQNIERGFNFTLMPNIYQYHADVKNSTQWKENVGPHSAYGYTCGKYGGVRSNQCPFYLSYPGGNPNYIRGVSKRNLLNLIAMTLSRESTKKTLTFLVIPSIYHKR